MELIPYSQRQLGSVLSYAEPGSLGGGMILARQRLQWLEVADRVNFAARWSGLRSIGASRLAALAALTPVIGYFILFNQHIIDWLSLHTDFCKRSGCGISWRMYFFYFGATFIGIGTTIFLIFCPLMVKRYSDSISFYEGMKAYYSHYDNLSNAFRLYQELHGQPYRDKLNLRQRAENGEVLGLEQMHVLAGILPAIYGGLDRTGWQYRWIVFGLYMLGFLLIAIPSVFTFIQILSSAFS